MEIGMTIIAAAVVFVVGWFVGARFAYKDVTKITLKAADTVEKLSKNLLPDVKAGADWAVMEFMSSMAGERLPSEALAKARYDSVVRPKKDS